LDGNEQQIKELSFVLDTSFFVLTNEIYFALGTMKFILLLR